MRDLSELHFAVLCTVASNRLGQPVFVRYLWQSPEKFAVAPRLAQMTAEVRDWLGQTLDRVYAIGTAASGQVSLALQFRGGFSALVSVARGQAHGDGVELLVLGNKGALYHDAGHAVIGAGPAPYSKEVPDPALVAVIRKALRSGKPEPVASGAEP
jgi:hypothetical protein